MRVASTPLGMSLSSPVEQLERWVAKNIFDALKAKERFDARQAKTAKTQEAA